MLALAALADFGKSLVLVCDSMLSAGDFSGDRITGRMYPLSERFQWWIMVSGRDITHIQPVIDAAIHKLLSLSDSTNTAETIERAVVEAYQGVRMRYAEDLILSPVGLTWDRFRSHAEWRPHLNKKLSAVDLGCEILVAGFGFAGDGHLFTVQNPGVARNHNFAGWISIGRGSYVAASMLLSHSVNCTMELPSVLYHACEAKFMAETAEGVGRHTLVKIARGTGTMDAVEVSEGLLIGIRTAWNNDGRARVPRGMIDELREKIAKHPPTHFTHPRATQS